MKIHSIFLVLVVATLLLSCDDNDVKKDKKSGDEYVPGDVIIGIKSDVSIDAVFDLMNEEGVTIDQMSGFFNFSTFPNDSLAYVIAQLKDKPYLNERGFSGGAAYISAVDHRITVTQFLFEMDVNAQQDWLTTLHLLKLEDLGNDTKNLLIKVEPGTEEQWINHFKEHPFVKWAEFNSYSDVFPAGE